MGQDLKADLGKINAHFASLPDAEKDGGVMRFADYPPTDDGASILTSIMQGTGRMVSLASSASRCNASSRSIAISVTCSCACMRCPIGSWAVSADVNLH
jgi:hypothetical protein